MPLIIFKIRCLSNYAPCLFYFLDHCGSDMSLSSNDIWIKGIIDQLLMPTQTLPLKIIVIKGIYIRLSYYYSPPREQETNDTSLKVEGRELTFTTCENKQQLNLYHHHLTNTIIQVAYLIVYIISRAMTIDWRPLYWIHSFVLQLQFIIIDDDMHIIDQ